jgi:lipopolysaccharide/colanic/teichoic acid biosynthesis glycosyltransferase
MSTTVPVLDFGLPDAPVTMAPPPVARGRGSFLECKRAIDFSIALALLTLFAPFLVFAAFAIEATSRGPAFYVQWRVGRRGRLFRMYKLRTMVRDAEEGTGPVWAADADPRITAIGALLRATHLDELPQLINVLKGEMSLVGPRPERPVFVRSFTRSIPNYAARLEVRPGITGLAQVCQGYDRSMADVKRKLAYDLIYIRRMCWLVDLRIIAATLGQVVPAGGKVPA